MTVLDILNEVAATSSGNEKQEILSRNVDNISLRTVCDLAYNPTINFYTTHTDAGKSQGPLSLLDACAALIDFVASREVTGNAARDFVGNLIASLCDSDAEVFRRVINRDLRAGISVSTINKVWKNLIPTFDFLLADTDTSRIVYPALSQLKADGMRAAMFIDPAKKVVTLISRNGKSIEVSADLKSAALELLKGQNPVTLDGELVCATDSTVLSRKVSNGILNKAIKGTITEEEASMIRFLAWDIVDKTSTIRYQDRFDTLTRMVEGSSYIQVLESRLVHNEQEALEHFKELRRKGEEGTILKNIDGKWVPKRSKDLCKFKAEVEGEFRVVGFEYGKGKNANKVGNLLIESEDGLVKCSVGIFKDFDETVRETWLTETPEIVTVMYNERITDKSRKDGSESLFLPRVTAVRYDKNTANTREELIQIENALLN